jgi:hypothetical protein
MNARTTLSLGFGLVVLVLASACGGSDETASAEDDIRGQPSAEELQALFRAVDDNCAGNSNGYMTRYNVATFKASEAMAEIKNDDKDAMGVDCSDQRSYSSSREDGAKMFLDHINDPLDSTKSCLKENLTASQRARLKQVVTDRQNVAVFSSIYSGGDNPEGCSYYNFRIYRRDGTLLELVFNYTD